MNREWLDCWISICERKCKTSCTNISALFIVFNLVTFFININPGLAIFRFKRNCFLDMLIEVFYCFYWSTILNIDVGTVLEKKPRIERNTFSIVYGNFFTSKWHDYGITIALRLWISTISQSTLRIKFFWIRTMTVNNTWWIWFNSATRSMHHDFFFTQSSRSWVRWFVGWGSSALITLSTSSHWQDLAQGIAK